MKFRRIALRTATHLGAAVLGGIVWWFAVGADRPRTAGAPAAVTAASSPSSRATAALQSRMAEEDESRKERGEGPGRSIRQRALEDIAQRSGNEREKAERFAKLSSLADTYRNTEDLRGVLATALAGNDTDNSEAIFLEWHRRDPAGAFDQLALLSGWMEALDGETAMALAFGKDELVAELAKPSRSDAFADVLMDLAGWNWGEADDLASLVKCHGSLPAEREEELIRDFLLNWVPSDGAAAVATLSASPQEFRRRFLTALEEGQYHVPHSAWTEEFAAALFRTNLGDSEDIRAKLEEQAKLAGEAPVAPGKSPAEAEAAVPPGAGTPEMDPAYLGEMVKQLVRGERDYPALFEAGEMDLPAIQAELLKKMPGMERYPEELAKVMFQHLAAYDPETALEWAKGKMPEDDIRGRSTIILRDVADPRLSRVSYLLSTLPTQYLEVDRSEMRVSASRSGKAMRERLAEWAIYAPGPAGEATEGIPPISALSPDPESEEEMQNFRNDEEEDP